LECALFVSKELHSIVPATNSKGGIMEESKEIIFVVAKDYIELTDHQYFKRQRRITPP